MINGRYQLHEKIGQGGMGIVHRATDRLTGETVALKQVFLPVEQIMFSSRPVSQTNRELRLALAHEFQTLAGLRHPNIISVLDYGFDENQQPFFTMSYLEEAQTIVAAANGRSAPEKAALLIQMLEALAYLHRRGILHRDLKPDNVLVVGDTVRVLDFGLAAAKEQATDSVGSWLYMAPEVLLGQPASEASDLYTVGVLAYRLLAGTHPFSIYAEDVIGEILDGEPDWSKVQGGEELTAVIRTLLAKEPNDRYPTANQATAAFYQALGQGAPQETAVIRESYLQAAKFVGRQAEMDQLVQAINQAKESQGSVWLVGGESGVGKSRLIEEFRSQALVAGWVVIRGQAITGGVPFQLWQNIIYHLALTVEISPLEASVLQTIAPQLGTLLEQKIPPPPKLDAKNAEQRLIFTIVDIVRRQKLPTVIIIEDLHWGYDSLTPLVALSRVIHHHQLIVLGTYRNDEQPHLPETLPEAQLILLQRLDEQAITALSESILGAQILAHPQVVTRLKEETEGNAFFLVEIIRALAEETGQLADIGRMTIPEKLLTGGIQQIVQRRLDKLPALYLPALWISAVVGRNLDERLLQYCIDTWQLEFELEAWLWAGQEAAVLDIFENQWRFSHDKLRETVLSNLPKAERPHLFRQVAEAIEQLYPNDPNQAEALTGYWQEAGNLEKVRQYAWQAGHHLAQNFANQEALRFLKVAYDHTPDTAHQEQTNILLARFKIYKLLGDVPAQQAQLPPLQTLLKQGQLPLSHQVEILVGIADFELNTVSEFTQAIETLQQALEYANQLNDPALQGRIYTLWGDALHRHGEISAALTKFQQALSLLTLPEHQAEKARLLFELVFMLSIEGLHAACVPYFDEMHQLYSQIEDKWLQATLANGLGVYFGTQGDQGKALTYFRKAHEISQAIGDQTGQVAYSDNIGFIYYQFGHFQAAEQAFITSLEAIRELGNAYIISINLKNLSSVRYWQSDYPTALSYIEEALTISRGIGSHRLAEELINLGFIQTKLHHYEAANQAFAEGLDLARDSGNVGLICEYQAHWAASLQQQGDNSRAMGLIEETLPHLDPSIFTSDQPFLIYWHCYEILQTHGDIRANSVLEMAYHTLLETAEKIGDAEFRASFLENVPHHRQIVKAYQALPKRAFSAEMRSTDTAVSPQQYSSQPEQTNETINGRYLLHNKLGQGGMGIVHRATDRLTGETVALKQVFLPVEQIMFSSRPVSQTNRELRLALAHEFQTLAGLRHPHIISVLDYGFDENQQPFFTMSYLAEAQTILAAANGRSAPEKAALLIQMLEALAYLHRRGILHRDLKPDNVLVVGDTVRVLDFGLAAAKEQATDSVGSWLYMAPEVLLGQPASEVSDLYTVGVLAYRLLAGTHPFNIYAEDVVGEILEGEPDWSKVQGGGELTAVIRTLLAKQPTQRYGSAKEAIAALHQALGQPLLPESQAIRESYLQAARFVGRETELIQLTTALDEAQAGNNTVWLMGGESGVGKSRLVEALRIRALVAGWQVIMGQAIAEGGVPYQLWHDALPYLVLNIDLSDFETAVLGQIAPTIGKVLGRPLPTVPTLGGEATQQRFIATLLAVLKRQTQPTLLIFEDVHWARESLAPLAYLLKNEADLPPLLIVATYRQDEYPHLPQTLAGAKQMMLDRLPETEITALSEAILGSHVTTAELVSFLTQQTEGNTFFIVEVMRVLAEEAGKLDNIGNYPLPTTILTGGMKQLLQRRIEKVSATDQALLQLAAINGRQLDLALLHHLNPDVDLAAWVQQVFDASLLMVRQGKWWFAHDKLREAILSDLPTNVRKRLHQSVAQAIEAVYKQAEPYHQLLLDHWYQAGNLEKQLDYLTPVVRHFVEITADYAAADQLLRRTIDQLPESDSRRISLRVWQARNEDYRGQPYQAQQFAEEAQALAEQFNDSYHIAASSVVLGNVASMLGNKDKARKYYLKSLAIYQTLDDQKGMSTALNNLGIVEAEIDPDKAYHYLSQSIALSRALQDERPVAMALNNLCILSLNKGDFEQALVEITESLVIFQALGEQIGIIYCLLNLGNIDHERQQYRQALAHYEQAYALLKTVEDTTGVILLFLNIGFALLQLQEFAAARRSFCEALNLIKLAQTPPPIRAICLGFAWLRWQQGGATEAAKLVGLGEKAEPKPILFFEKRQAELWQLLQSVQNPDDLAQARESGRLLDLDTVLQSFSAECADGGAFPK